MKTYAIIPSGGTGKRAGTDLPKQYLIFNEKEMLAHTLEVFQKCGKIDEIIIAAKKEHFDLILNIKKKYELTKISNIIEGGSERQDSVANALNSIAADDEDVIVVHDAARPLLDQEILEDTIQCAQEHGSGVAAVKARDTLIRINDKGKEYIDRENVYYVQTPQAFKYKILMKSLQYAQKTGFYGTDESMLLKNAEYDFRIVESKIENVKITTKSDLGLYEKIIRSASNKI
jgi:2-C-methyl-D-erythritol 4-phosphate cytidylyltransferase